MKLDFKNAWGNNARLIVGEIKRQLHKSKSVRVYFEI